MPVRPPSIRACGCVVAYGERCHHMIARDSARRAASDARRPSAAARGYDSKWRQARAGFLAKHPRCFRCGNSAAVVHHSVPHRGDRELFWNRSLWRPACQPCHDGPLQSEERRST